MKGLSIFTSYCYKTAILDLKESFNPGASNTRNFRVYHYEEIGKFFLIAERVLENLPLPMNN
jgi:hypothetical protein